MKSTWVVVADSTRARILKADNAVSPLSEIETLVHPESRLHERDLISDAPGRAFDRAGQGRHAMGQQVSPKEHEVEAFVRQVAERLEQARDQGELEQLIIVAPPNVLGKLRKALPHEVARLVTLEVDKNLSKLSPQEIRGHLPERLPPLPA
jgi:protein required for attachment to host cells